MLATCTVHASEFTPKAIGACTAAGTNDEKRLSGDFKAVNDSPSIFRFVLSDIFLWDDTFPTDVLWYLCTVGFLF